MVVFLGKNNSHTIPEKFLHISMLFISCNLNFDSLRSYTGGFMGHEETVLDFGKALCETRSPW